MTAESDGLLISTDHGTDEESYISNLEYRLAETQRKLRRLEEETGEDADKDTRGRGGTPNRSGDISAALAGGRPTDVELLQMASDNRTLHEAVSDGPEAFVRNGQPTYPVHDRAHDVLVHAESLARGKSADGSTVFLTAPSVKRFLETRCGERLKHTQVRRVFEQIEDAGRDYPREPILHKNRDGVIELALFDYDRILGQPL